MISCQSLKAQATNEDEAYRKAGEAFYKQSGLDKIIDRLDKRYVPEFVHKYGGWIYLVQDSYSTQQVKYVWRYEF